MDVIQTESIEASHSSFLSSDPPSISGTKTSLTVSPSSQRSTLPSASDETNSHQDDNIDWDLVTKQLETVREAKERFQRHIDLSCIRRNYKLLWIRRNYYRIEMIRSEGHGESMNFDRSAIQFPQVSEMMMIILRE